MSETDQGFTMTEAADREKLLARIRETILLIHVKIFTTLNTIRKLLMSGATGASGQIAALATDVASLTVAVNALEAGYATLLQQIATTSSLTPADAASLTDSINQITADAASAVAAVAGPTGTTGNTGP